MSNTVGTYINTIKAIIPYNIRLFKKENLLKYSEDGNLSAVKKCISNGVDVNCKTTRNKSTPLYLSSVQGHLDIVKCLVDNGADVNCKIDYYNNTPLHESSSYGHLEIVKILIENGADINCKDKWEQTPLMFSSRYGHLEIVKYLIENGAVVNCKSNIGSTPLILSSRNGHLEIVKVLIENGAEVNCKNYDGDTPLIFSSQYGHSEIVKVLIENGADVNCKNIFKWTPLIRASYRGHLEIVKVLIENGVDVNCKNDNGDTPLHISSRYGHLEIVKCLIEYGVDWNIKNNHNKDFLDYLSNENKDIIIKEYPEQYRKHILKEGNLNEEQKTQIDMIKEPEDIMIKKPEDIKVSGLEIPQHGNGISNGIYFDDKILEFLGHQNIDNFFLNLKTISIAGNNSKNESIFMVNNLQTNKSIYIRIVNNMVYLSKKTEILRGTEPSFKINENNKKIKNISEKLQILKNKKETIEKEVHMQIDDESIVILNEYLQKLKNFFDDDLYNINHIKREFNDIINIDVINI
jgi:ankyrin repeat protein